MFPSILPFNFDLIYRSFLDFWGLNGLYEGLGSDSKIVLGSTRIEQQLFSMFPSDFEIL